MVDIREWTAFEKGSLLLSLLLLVVGFAELTEVIDLLPMNVYLLALWVIALSTWIHRRRLP